jgi:hypothetical protein
MTDIKFSIYNNKGVYTAPDREAALKAVEKEKKYGRVAVVLPKNASINTIKAALLAAKDEMDEMDKFVLSSARKLHR